MYLGDGSENRWGEYDPYPEPGEPDPFLNAFRRFHVVPGTRLVVRRQRAFADIKAAIELRCETAQAPLSIQEVCDMSALRDLLPARRTRAVSRAALAAAVVCGGFVVASGETAHGDDPTVLNGTYRMYFDGQGSTVDGVPVCRTAETYFYAFRSACLADGCVANGTRLNPVPESSLGTGSTAAVFDEHVNFRFTYGRWVRSAPYGRPCGDGQQGAWMTEWSLTPQGRGVLTGTRKDSPAGTLCPGDAGGYLTEPITATRERDVDPGVDVTTPT